MARSEEGAPGRGAVARTIDRIASGFRPCPHAQQDRHFHAPDRENIPFEHLETGSLVTFLPEKGPKGLRARQVTLIQEMTVDPAGE